MIFAIYGLASQVLTIIQQTIQRQVEEDLYGQILGTSLLYLVGIIHLMCGQAIQTIAISLWMFVRQVVLQLKSITTTVFQLFR